MLASACKTLYYSSKTAIYYFTVLTLACTCYHCRNLAVTELMKKEKMSEMGLVLAAGIRRPHSMSSRPLYIGQGGTLAPQVIVRFTGNTAKVATAKTSNADDIHMLFSNVARPKKITNVNNCNLHRGMSTPSPTQLHKTNSFLLFRPLTHQCADKPDGKSALDVQIQPTVFPDLGHAYIKKGRASEVIGGNSKCYSTTHWQ